MCPNWALRHERGLEPGGSSCHTARMGIFDGVLGGVLGAQAGQILGGLLGEQPRSGAQGGAAAPTAAPGTGATQSNLVAAALELIQRNGGLGGLMQLFQRSGLAGHLTSWIGTGQNQAVGASALLSAFGGTQVTEVAQKFGISQTQLGEGLSSVLPELINKMTPTGAVPANDQDLVSGLLGQLLGNKT